MYLNYLLLNKLFFLFYHNDSHNQSGYYRIDTDIVLGIQKKSVFLSLSLSKKFFFNKSPKMCIKFRLKVSFS